MKLVAAEFEWPPPRKRADAPFRPSRRRVICNVSDLCRYQCPLGEVGRGSGQERDSQVLTDSPTPTCFG